MKGRIMPADREGGRLLFVYNADGGAVSAVVDALHKLVSPGTYSCSLCAVTYGAVAMRSEWKRYIARLPYPATFLHRDEYRALWPTSPTALPAILFQPDAGEQRVLVGAEEMNREQTVAELIALLEQALAVRPGSGSRSGSRAIPTDQWSAPFAAAGWCR